MGRLSLPGIPSGTVLYECLAACSSAAEGELKRKTSGVYHLAMEALDRNDLKEARLQLESVLAEHPEDLAAQHHLDTLGAKCTIPQLSTYSMVECPPIGVSRVSSFAAPATSSVSTVGMMG